MPYQDSVNSTVLTETYLDEANKQNVMKYASAAARTADAALTAVLREGMLSYQDDTNCYYVYTGSVWSTIGPGHGALTAWSPVIVQSGTVTATATAAYTRTGRWIQGYFETSVTGAGTASNVITVSLPVAATRSSSNTFIGTGKVFDASAPAEAPALLVLNSSTTLKFLYPNASSAAQYLGLSILTAALASTDVVCGQFAYEAAADA